jgi:AraC-like DNA-binding protein
LQASFKDEGFKTRQVALPMSRAVLDQQMREAIGRTAKTEILRVQLDHVKRLLAETDLSFSQIADRAGFRHPQYMAELFKKKCGKTPGQYRSDFQDLYPMGRQPRMLNGNASNPECENGSPSVESNHRDGRMRTGQAQLPPQR